MLNFVMSKQASSCEGQSCTDQIATMHIIVEQSIEWNLSLYINFVDYEKAFDSVDRETLWKFLCDVVKINAANTNQITLDGEAWEETWIQTSRP